MFCSYYFGILPKTKLKQELWTVQTFLILKQSCWFPPLQSILLKMMIQANDLKKKINVPIHCHCVLFTTCSSMIQWTKSAVWNQEEEGGKEERPILAETPPISCGIHGNRRRRHNGRNAVYKKRRIGGRGSPARTRVVGVWGVQDEVKQKNTKKKKKNKTGVTSVLFLFQSNCTEFKVDFLCHWLTWTGQKVAGIMGRGVSIHFNQHLSEDSVCFVTFAGWFP